MKINFRSTILLRPLKRLQTLFYLIVYTCLILCNGNLLIQFAHAGEYQLIPGVIHVHSTISNGEKGPEEIVQLAREKGVKVIIFTDHDTMKWAYGLQPLRKIIQKVVDQNSILKYGAANYINTMDELDKKYPDITVIHAVEAIPFYYWQGSVFKKNLELVRGDEHIMAIGLEAPSDYEGLPSIGNGYPGKFDRESIFSLWPISFFVLGWWLVSIRKRNSGGRKGIGIPGLICFFIGTIFLVNNSPFKTPLFDQYHGKQGVAPFQYLIDYANKKDALTFWAHPEVERTKEIGSVKVQKLPYDDHLLKTSNYTGIAVFSEGMRRIGPPGGIWDQILLQYCSGEREKPVWVIGEVDYKVERFPIDETQTILMLKERSKEAILNALKTGKMYAVMGTANALNLNSFVIEDDNGKPVFMGDEVALAGKPRIRIVVTVDYSNRYSDYQKRDYKIDLIRNGKVIKTFEADGPIDIVYDDDYYKPGEKVFYRLAIDTSYLFRGIISNPIFVKFEEQS